LAPRLKILLCTLNGARFLHEQLMSFEAQSLTEWDLVVSDDGSKDETLEILAGFRQRWQGRHEVSVFEGPGRGVAVNYLGLLCRPEVPVAPVALSDQDDVWHPEKLSRAMNGLAVLDERKPGLYGALSTHVNAQMVPVGSARVPARPLSFANALVQNVISGQTVALNEAALHLIRRAGVPPDLPFHDWWIYQLVTAAGGQVLLDPERVVAYRQHENNSIGANTLLRGRLRRLRQILDGTYGRWIQANLAALAGAEEHLTPEARAIVSTLADPRPGPARARAMWRAGLYRQEPHATALVYLAALLGRI